MVFRLFLYGSDQERMTNLLLRGLPAFRLLAGGYVLVSLEKEQSDREIGMVTPAEAVHAAMPYKMFADTSISMGGEIDQSLFLHRFSESIDEIYQKNKGLLIGVGKYGQLDSDLTKTLLDLFSEEIPCAGMLEEQIGQGSCSGVMAEETEQGILFSRLKSDQGTCLLYADELEDEQLLQEIRVWEDQIMDWSQHRKFDPLAKLRFRQARKQQ